MNKIGIFREHAVNSQRQSLQPIAKEAASPADSFRFFLEFDRSSIVAPEPKRKLLCNLQGDRHKIVMDFQ